MADGQETELERARAAAARGDWSDAYAALREADLTKLDGRGLELLADAAWWTCEMEDGREVPDSSGQGFLLIVEATVQRFTGDIDGAFDLARRAVVAGERIGDRNLLAMAIHTEGLVLIAAGRIGEGLALLDDAMTSVFAGELTSFFTGIVYCNVIAACLDLGDLRRASEWVLARPATRRALSNVCSSIRLRAFRNSCNSPRILGRPDARLCIVRATKCAGERLISACHE
jgi:hypothetical protein